MSSTDPMERAREAVARPTCQKVPRNTDGAPCLLPFGGVHPACVLTALSEAGLLPGEDEVVVPRSFVGAVRAFFERSRPFPHPVEYDVLRDELSALQERGT